MDNIQNLTDAGWIKPDGSLLCIPKMNHRHHCDYSEAHVEGWVGIMCGVVYHPNASPSGYSGLGLRLNPRTVTYPALQRVLQLLEVYPTEEVYIDDAFTEQLVLRSGERLDPVTIKRARKLFRDFIAYKQEVVNSHNKGRIKSELAEI